MKKTSMVKSKINPKALKIAIANLDKELFSSHCTKKFSGKYQIFNDSLLATEVIQHVENDLHDNPNSLFRSKILCAVPHGPVSSPPLVVTKKQKQIDASLAMQILQPML